MPTDKYVIMANDDFLMKGASLDFKSISWAGHRNLAETFDYETACKMKDKFNEYREVEIVNWKDTVTFGKRSKKYAD